VFSFSPSLYFNKKAILIIYYGQFINRAATQRQAISYKIKIKKTYLIFI
jgi:hypothetical protein